MARTSPTQKALKELRAAGWTVGIVEHWNPFAKIRQDLYGCIDLVCMLKGCPLLAVQVTSRSNLTARMTKSRAVAEMWVSTGANFQVWGYGTTKTKGRKRAVRMDLSGEWIEIEEAS